MSVITKRYGWVDNKEFYRRVIFLKGVRYYGKIPKSRSRDCSIIARLDDDPSRSGQAMVSGLTGNGETNPS
jgi:hypothetical protein